MSFFLFAVRFFLLPRGYFFSRVVISFVVTVVGYRSFVTTEISTVKLQKGYRLSEGNLLSIDKKMTEGEYSSVLLK